MVSWTKARLKNQWNREAIKELWEQILERLSTWILTSSKFIVRTIKKNETMTQVIKYWRDRGKQAKDLDNCDKIASIKDFESMSSCWELLGKMEVSTLSLLHFFGSVTGFPRHPQLVLLYYLFPGNFLSRWSVLIIWYSLHLNFIFHSFFFLFGDISTSYPLYFLQFHFLWFLLKGYVTLPKMSSFGVGFFWASFSPIYYIYFHCDQHAFFPSAQAVLSAKRPALGFLIIYSGNNKWKYASEE